MGSQSLTVSPTALWPSSGTLPHVIGGSGDVSDWSDASYVQSQLVKTSVPWGAGSTNRTSYQWDAPPLDLPPAARTKNRQMLITSRFQIVIDEFPDADHFGIAVFGSASWLFATGGPNTTQDGIAGVSWDGGGPGPIEQRDNVEPSGLLTDAEWDLLAAGTQARDGLSPYFRLITSAANSGQSGFADVPAGSRYFVNLYELEATVTWDPVVITPPPLRRYPPNGNGGSGPTNLRRRITRRPGTY